MRKPRVRAIPGPIQVKAYRPTIDPTAPVTDRWFAASGFAVVPRPGNAGSGIAAVEAEAVTAEAVEAKTRGDARPEKTETDRRIKALELRRGAELHLLASELRREAGAWAECAENFEALARYHLERKETVAVEAYLRKLLYVSDYVTDDVGRFDACEFAVRTYLAVERFDEAASVAMKAEILLKGCEDEGLAKRAADLSETVARRHGSDPGKRRKIKAMQVLAPAEFQLRALPSETVSGRDGDTSWSTSGHAIDLLMRPPRSTGECRYWVSHRISKGSHEFVALPNWAGRAMHAAEAMVELSEKDRAGTVGPSSAVLQVACALEAFTNSVVHFIRGSDQERWHERMPPKYCRPETGEMAPRASTQDKLVDIGNRLFGANWAPDGLTADLAFLFKLRDQLVHFKGDNEEVIHPKGIEDNWYLIEAGNRKIEIRPGPGPWIERVLTYGLAGWATKLGHDLIAAFRHAWARQQQQFHVYERDVMRVSEIMPAAPETDAPPANDRTMREDFDKWRLRNERSKKTKSASPHRAEAKPAPTKTAPPIATVCLDRQTNGENIDGVGAPD